MLTYHSAESDFFLKKTALEGALSVYSKNLNIACAPEKLLEEPIFSEIVSTLENYRNTNL